MKKVVVLLSSISAILLVLLVVVLLYKDGRIIIPVINLPQFSIPKVTPAPTNTMLNELDSGAIDKDVSDEKMIKAEGVMVGSIKQGIIEASNFKFTPDAISVNEGDTVAITFKSTQGMHNFTIDELNVKSKTINEGQFEEISFVASKKGTFKFYCNVGQHKVMGMVGTIVVN